MLKQYDLIVLGGGAGGLTVAAGAASLGAKVALIEKEENPGGDCLHFGCVPSKALIKAANEVYQMKRTAEKHGMEIKQKINMKAIKAKVKSAILSIQEHDDADRFRKMGIDVYIGKGVFRNEHEIEVEGNKVIFGKRIVISTGSRPFIPPIEGIKDIDFLTNETIFDIEYLPNKLLVVGGGPIGLELAQSFARLGSEVTVVERSASILNKEDEEVQAYMTEHLKSEMTILTNASVEKVSQNENQKIVTIQLNDKPMNIEIDEILIASGRVPNSDSLQLEKAGVQKNERGFILVNEYLQTNIPHIYAIGDVNGQMMFTHVAGMEGKIVVQNAVVGFKQKVRYDNVSWVTFTSPEIFHLGLTEKEAKEKHGEIKVYKSSLSEVDRFITDHHDKGFVKIITDLKGNILGAHAIGEGAGDFMQLVVFAKENRHKIGALSRMVYPYPNHAAAIQQTADLYWREKLFSGWVPKVMKKYIELFR